MTDRPKSEDNSWIEDITPEQAKKLEDGDYNNIRTAAEKAPTNQTETCPLGSIVPRQSFTDAAGGTGNEDTGNGANYLRPCSVRARAIS